VALGDTHLHFGMAGVALAHINFLVLRGRRCAYRTGLALVAHVPVVSILVRIMFFCVLLYQVDRRAVVCHLGMTCAWGQRALFPTEYDSKGYGLMRLAGYTPSLPTQLCEGRVGEC